MYNRTPGSTVQIPNGATSLELFCRFFADEVWELLLTEANWYAHDHPSIKPTSLAYDDVNVDEMKAFVIFIGVLILIGILRLPCLEMYWSTQKLH